MTAAVGKLNLETTILRTAPARQLRQPAQAALGSAQQQVRHVARAARGQAERGQLVVAEECAVEQQHVRGARTLVERKSYARGGLARPATAPSVIFIP